MLLISVTLPVAQLPTGWLNADALSNILLISVTAAVFHEEMSWLNEDADQNIWYILVTEETSQLEISALKSLFPLNTFSILSTPDTSHEAMATPLESWQPAPVASEPRQLFAARAVVKVAFELNGDCALTPTARARTANPMHAPTKPRLSAPRILTARVRVFFSRVDIIVVRRVDRAVGESDACTRLLLRRTVKLEVRRKVRFGGPETRRAR